MNKEIIDERRSLCRVELDTPYFARLSVIGGGSHRVMLSNISARGLQAELPTEVGPEDIPGNARVELSEFPGGLEQLNRLSGTVTWVTQGHCGVQFERELEDANFLEFLGNL